MEKAEDNMTQETPEIFPVIKRKTIVNNTKIHLTSIFTGQRKLEEALENIVVRKLKESGLWEAG